MAAPHPWHPTQWDVYIKLYRSVYTGGSVTLTAEDVEALVGWTPYLSLSRDTILRKHGHCVHCVRPYTDCVEDPCKYPDHGPLQPMTPGSHGLKLWDLQQRVTRALADLALFFLRPK